MQWNSYETKSKWILHPFNGVSARDFCQNNVKVTNKAQILPTGSTQFPNSLIPQIYFLSEDNTLSVSPFPSFISEL